MSRSLQFDIVANDKATATLKNVEGIAGKFARSIGSYFSSFLTLQNIAGRILDFATSTLTWASGLKDTAAAAGVTAEEFQKLEYAAKLSGVSSEELISSFKRLRITLKDASNGSAEASKIFKILGYSQEQIASGNIDIQDAFLRVSKAISAASNEQDKFNIASAFFGDKIAMNVVKMLGNYGELKQNIADTPLISNEEAEILDRYQDGLDRIIVKMRVLFAQKVLGGPGNFLPDLIPGGTGFSAVGDVANLMQKKSAATGAEPVTQQDKDAAAALAEAGRKKTNAAALAAGQPAFSTLAQIGGAAGFNGRAGKTPELTALEQIESNTRPQGAVPANGATDFTKGPDAGYEAAAARARTIPTFNEYFARAARRAR